MQPQTSEDLGDKLKGAVLDAALASVGEDGLSAKDAKAKQRVAVSPLTGAQIPVGRQKGSVNKVTRTIREAVEKAARDCHPAGLAGWLIERAQGGIQDRQIFAQMVGKALPLQVNANVDGGIKLELSWLSARSIGTTAAQIPEQRTQVIDLEQDSSGGYRIRDQAAQAPGGAEGAEAPGERPTQKGAGDAQGG